METELVAYKIVRQGFMLNEWGFPVAVGVRCVFISPVERTEVELDRVGDVMELFLDKRQLDLYTEEDATQKPSADNQDD